MTIGEKLKRTRMFSLCYVTKTRVPTGKRTNVNYPAKQGKSFDIKYIKIKLEVLHNDAFSKVQKNVSSSIVLPK